MVNICVLDNKFIFICCQKKNLTNAIIMFQSVTLHTDVGDIKIELFCEMCAKTCEVLELLTIRAVVYNCMFLLLLYKLLYRCTRFSLRASLR